jgi:hypothetical protein
VPPKTACAYAEKRLTGTPAPAAMAKAGQEWQRGSGERAWGEFDDGDHRLVRLETIDDLQGAPATGSLAEEYPDEPHLFGVLARHIWEPLLRQELKA